MKHYQQNMLWPGKMSFKLGLRIVSQCRWMSLLAEATRENLNKAQADTANVVIANRSMFSLSKALSLERVEFLLRRLYSDSFNSQRWAFHRIILEQNLPTPAPRPVAWLHSGTAGHMGAGLSSKCTWAAGTRPSSWGPSWLKTSLHAP